MSNDLIINDETIMALDKAAESGLIANTHASKFQRAAIIATSTNNLIALLTKEVVDKLFMPLQGKKIGFKTDRDNAYGDKPKKYDWQTVRDCVIEAVMTGVDVVGNEFNIIAGNCYITKEGMGHLLSDVKNLDYSVTPMIPKVVSEKGATIIMNLEWNHSGTAANRNIEICVKVNKMMGSDAIIGKATRKARAWLLQHVTGQEIGDGDADDLANENRKKSGADLMSDLPGGETVEAKAKVVEETPEPQAAENTTVAHIVEAIGLPQVQITSYYQALADPNWKIEKSISELSQGARSWIMDNRDSVKASIEAFVNPPTKPVINSEQLKRLQTIKSASGKTEEYFKQYLKEIHGLTSSKNVTVDIYEDVCNWIENGADSPQK